jgi:hypothetical protein
MLYTLELRDGSNWIEDEVALPDRERAFEYARTVVRELMCCRERQTRTWRLDVYEDKGARVFEIPFARTHEFGDEPIIVDAAHAPAWPRRSASLPTASRSS